MNKTEIKNKLKYIVTMLVSYMLRVLWIIPMKKDSIFFISFDGKQYSDSPLVLSQRIKKQYPEKRIVWALNDVNMKDVKADVIVDRNSFEFYKQITSCGTIISNNTIPSFVPIRKKQIFINTWHGCCPTKKLGLDELNHDPYVKYHMQIQDRKTTAMLSGLKWFDETVMGHSFGFKRVKPLDFGLPRNDLLFADHPEIVEKVYQYFGLDRSVGIILYAPTFRGNANNGAFIKDEDLLDVQTIVDVCEKKFNKKFVFLFRAHHAMNPNCMPGCINATAYPDMQQLLYAIDILLTDYSSCMHDIALMRRPCFLYVPDVEEYMRDRGMYYTVQQYPFNFGTTKEDFVKCIEQFDQQKYLVAVEEYLEGLGNVEDGHATERTIQWLSEQWSKQ